MRLKDTILVNFKKLWKSVNSKHVQLIVGLGANVSVLSFSLFEKFDK